VIITEENYLAHYGILRKSGRYPWGSGGDQSTRNRDFLGYIDGLKKDGLSETEIARGLGVTTTQLRAARSIARSQEKQAEINMAQRLKDKGYSNVAIGERMGKSESYVRSLLAPGQKDKADVLQATSEMLKNQVEEKGYLDIGSGVEHHVGVSQTKLKAAVAMLQEEGYTVHYVKVEQLGTGQQTTVKVLAKPDTPYSEVFRNRANIKQVTSYSEDGGRSFLGLQPPLSVSSGRVAVRYAEQGGTDADGVIYVRPGVDDLSLGKSRYAQVRIAVDNSHYLKGMAMYRDDLPDGVDLVFNTNKKSTGNKLDAMKPLKDDPDNPFGAVVRQIVKQGPNGKAKVVSAMNIVNEEGDWENWAKSLSSQMLSKQSPSLAKTQLDMTYEKKRNDLEEIMSLTNPAVRRKLLESYADDADSSAVHLKAAALPRQGSHVILPINSLKESEIYAPNFRNGERVVLIRYPHGGIFEIPELTVNNRHAKAKRALGNAKDAVGINSKVAERLSGADFDGDTVLVIPNNNRKVKTAPALDGLKDFDPVRAYPAYEGMSRMSPRTKQKEMGVVSNLITDMTIRGATASELARAVRHSMVVIDAEKHNLNYKQSAVDNGIAQLKAKYQGDAKAGASTLISKASAEIRVPERRPRPAAKGGPVDRATGRRVYEETGATYLDPKTGKLVRKTVKSKKLAETDDASTLSSGTPIEKVYADHSNRLKGLANAARKAAVSTRSTPYSPSAKTAYSKEVAALDAKLNLALRNAPLERQAQILANATVTQKRQANPDMDAAELKKIKAQALAEARLRTGARKQRIQISDAEWDAIQAGAISGHKLNQILNNADLDQVKRLATPKSSTVMTTAKKNRALAMAASGYTQAEIADALGVSLTTLKTTIAE
jgi:DNA-binding CsgD family transcriptional regulator